jgi:Zn-dependent protease
MLQANPMAQTPSSSPTDWVQKSGRGLAFSLFGVPIRVASSFWFIAILFGLQDVGQSGNTGQAIAEALTWTAIVFVSILLHEFGHATAARVFGAEPAITLHALGGLTQFEARGMTRPQRWLISFAGPAAGLLLGIAVFVGSRVIPHGPEAVSIVRSILWVNIGWSIINLLPVLPFDGGQMLSAFLGPRRELWTAIVSGVVGTSVALVGYFQLNNLWIAFLFGSAGVTAIRQVKWLWQDKTDRDAGLEDELAKVRAAIAHGNVGEVLGIGGRIVEKARSSSLKNAGLLALAWAAATSGRRDEARTTIERLERDTPADPYLIAAVEDALGAPERARAWLEVERRQGVRRTESTKLLIDLYARAGELERATELASESLDVLTEEDARAVLAAARGGKAEKEAASLANAIEQAYGARSERPIEGGPSNPSLDIKA